MAARRELNANRRRGDGIRQTTRRNFSPADSLQSSSLLNSSSTTSAAETPSVVMRSRLPPTPAEAAFELPQVTPLGKYTASRSSGLRQSATAPRRSSPRRASSTHTVAAPPSSRSTARAHSSSDKRRRSPARRRTAGSSRSTTQAKKRAKPSRNVMLEENTPTEIRDDEILDQLEVILEKLIDNISSKDNYAWLSVFEQEVGLQIDNVSQDAKEHKELQSLQWKLLRNATRHRSELLKTRQQRNNTQLQARALTNAVRDADTRRAHTHELSDWLKRMDAVRHAASSAAPRTLVARPDTAAAATTLGAVRAATTSLRAATRRTALLRAADV